MHSKYKPEEFYAAIGCCSGAFRIQAFLVLAHMLSLPLLETDLGRCLGAGGELSVGMLDSTWASAAFSWSLQLAAHPCPWLF